MDTDETKATLTVPAAGAASDVAMESGESSNGDDSQMRDIHDLEERIGYSLHTFDEAPFTIQRIAELLAQPQRHLPQCDKILAGGRAHGVCDVDGGGVPDNQRSDTGGGD
ncbi:hypothetical protein DL89DRAFT_259742 [Linderina pennispora]|uniref:Uncharacterized protein n=1 Tax=Linderina pennispora TaxID=61395 RepID=A0A1Y1W1W9_9FUNG|nr:uncharacterized protein DL89DRAFT_259742 [Linderina pennispora]ORX67236.1 hypothetical protein DL89DRAFT_259742 [Linderina pennispora]